MESPNFLITNTKQFYSDKKFTRNFTYEDITILSAAAGTYDFTINGVAVTAFTAELYVENMVYWSTFTPALAAPGDFFEALVSDVEDAAGNTITALSSATCTVGVASETALEP